MPPAAPFATPAAASPPPAPRYAGFLARVGAFLLDSLVIQAVAVAIPIADAMLFEGELGTSRSYEVARSEVVAESEESVADVEVRTYSRTLEVRIDAKGRSATYEIETTTEQRPGLSRSRTVQRQLEADPGWGGKYALHTVIGYLLGFLAYFAALWSSRWRATVGGRALSLRVIDEEGNRISFPRAVLRVVAAVVSLVTVLGILTIPVTRRKQALHDLIARTVVIDERAAAPVPGIDPPGGGAQG